MPGGECHGEELGGDQTAKSLLFRACHLQARSCTASLPEAPQNM